MYSQNLIPAILFLLSYTPSIYAQSFSSYAEWLDGVPTCARDCFDGAFGKVVDACGVEPDSTAPKDLQCICSGEGTDLSASDQYQDGLDAGKCAARTCTTADSQQLTDDLLNLTEWCVNIVADGSSVSGSASSSSSDGATSKFLVYCAPCPAILVD
jgi:hypothetical protein